MQNIECEHCIENLASGGRNCSKWGRTRPEHVHRRCCRPPTPNCSSEVALLSDQIGGCRGRQTGSNVCECVKVSIHEHCSPPNVKFFSFSIVLNAFAHTKKLYFSVLYLLKYLFYLYINNLCTKLRKRSGFYCIDVVCSQCF